MQYVSVDDWSPNNSEAWPLVCPRWRCHRRNSFRVYREMPLYRIKQYRWPHRFRNEFSAARSLAIVNYFRRDVCRKNQNWDRFRSRKLVQLQRFETAYNGHRQIEQRYVEIAAFQCV